MEEEEWSPGSRYITAMSEQRERGEMRQRGVKLWGGRGRKEGRREGLICGMERGDRARKQIKRHRRRQSAERNTGKTDGKYSLRILHPTY